MAINAQQIKILLVDSSPDNLQFLSDILICQGYQVQKVTSANLLINAAITSVPDLIFLDIFLPDMDGYDVWQYLQSHQTTQDIPVIFLGQKSELIKKIQFQQIYAVDFISKPLQNSIT